MQLSVQHRTTYRFSSPVKDVVQLLRLTPESCVNQTVLDWRIDVDCDARLREGRDGYGNCIHMLYVNEPVAALSITAIGRVITEDCSGVVQGLPAELPHETFLRFTPLTQPNGAIQRFADELNAHGEPLAKLHFLNAALHQRMAFGVDQTNATTTASAAFTAGHGVCQDFAHIFIAVARLAGMPVRYVSGHLYRRNDCPQNAGHAWVEAWVPALGWVAFDPTNGICADDSYIRVASGLDYAAAAPIAGSRTGGGSEDMSVDIQVSKVKRRSQSQSQSQSAANDRPQTVR